MKHRFLKTVMTAVPLALAIVLGAKLMYLHHVEAELVPQFKLGEGKNVVAIGNSHGQDAINDSILTHWANKCRSGEMNFGTYAMLQRLLAENKVDTVVLQMLDFKGYADKSIDTKYLLWETTRMAVLDCATLKDIAKASWTSVVSFYLTNDLYTMTQPSVIGGYEDWHHQGLALEMKDRETHLAKVGHRDAYPREPLSAFSYQTRYMTKIMQLCERYGTKVVVMNYPKANYSRYIDRSVGYDYYALLGDSILVADYEHFAFPDTSYYGDMTHLNYKGAAIFCNDLKRHGLKTQCPKDWRPTAK